MKKVWLHHSKANGSSLRRLLKTIVLVGMMGAGKTAVGLQLAKMLGVSFLDSDDEIMNAAQRSIAEIFERDGEEFFRARETEVLRRLFVGRPCVLSTGGGAFMSECNRAIIQEAGISVWLEADLPTLWSRVRNKTTRPLLRTQNPYATLKSIYELREPTYRLAALSVKCGPDLTVEDMAKKVCIELRHQDNLFEKG
jgi:shikimate kinase